MAELIDKQAAIDAFLTELTKRERKNLLHTWSTVEVKYFVADMLEKMPSAQPEVAKDTNVSINDIISRQAVRYKLAALVNEFEEILSNIREREVDDSVCGLCEYDGAYIGESGDWCNECPGFEKDDCFKLKEKYRKEWTDING